MGLQHVRKDFAAQFDCLGTFAKSPRAQLPNQVVHVASDILSLDIFLVDQRPSKIGVKSPVRQPIYRLTHEARKTNEQRSEMLELWLQP